MRLYLLLVTLLLLVGNIKLYGQTLGEQLNQTYLNKFNQHQQHNQQQKDALVEQLSNLNSAQAWQRKSTIRNIVWRYLTTPQLFDHWVTCSSLPEDIKNDYLISDVNNIRNNRLAVFANQMKFKAFKQIQYPKDCQLPLNANLDIENLPYSTHQDLLFKHLLLLLHLDETSTERVLFSIKKPLPKHVNGEYADNMALWLVGASNIYREFHDQYSFPTIELSNAIKPLTSGDNDAYIRAVNTISWRQHRQANKSTQLFDFIEQKEQYLHHLQQGISACTYDKGCIPSNQTMWFYNASHIHPPLTRYQPKSTNGVISAIEPRDKNHWLNQFLASLTQGEYQQLPLLERQRPQKGFSKLKKANVSYTDILKEAPLWIQAKQIKKTEVILPNLPISEDIAETKFKASLTKQTTNYSSSQKSAATPYPLISPEVFSRVFSHAIAFEIAEQNLIKIPAIEIESGSWWRLALASEEIAQILESKYKLSKTPQPKQSVHIMLSVEKNPNNYDNHHQINAAIHYQGKVIKDLQFHVKTPWPYWFAQKKWNIPVIMGVIIFLLVLIIAGFGYSLTRDASYKDNWPYSDDKQPKRKRYFAYIMLMFPFLMFAVLNINALQPKTNSEEQLSSYVHFYIPTNKSIDEQYQNLVSQLSTDVYQLYQQQFIQSQQQYNAQQTNSMLTSIKNNILSGFDEVLDVINWFKNIETDKPIAPPKFKISQYGWFPNTRQPNKRCKDDYSSYTPADFKFTLAQCWKQLNQQWQADVPPIYQGRNIDAATATIIFHDGSHGQLQMPKLKKLHQPHQRIISIFIPSYSTNSQDTLKQRLSWVVNNSDITCIIQSSGCTVVNIQNIANIDYSDFDSFLKNPDIDKKQSQWINHLAKQANISQQSQQITQMIAKHDLLLNSPNAAANVDKQPIKRIHLALPHSQWRGVIIMILCVLLITCAFYYHQDTQVKTISTAIITVILGTMLALLSTIVILWVGQLFIATNGTPLNAITIYLLFAFLVFIILPTAIYQASRLLLAIFPQHSFVSANRVAPMAAHKRQPIKFKQRINALIFVTLPLLLFMLATVIWITAPTDVETPKLIPLLNSYILTMLLATLCWILATLMFYHPYNRFGSSNAIAQLT